MTLEPAFHLRCFMCAVIVHHNMNANIWLFDQRGVDLVKEFDEFLLPMAAMAFANHFARSHVEGGKKRGDPMAFIVVRATLRLPWPQRQKRLRAIERLHLGFFVNTQNNGTLRWVEIQAYNVTNLFDEKRICRQFESVRAVRLQTKSTPDTADGHRRKPHGLGHAPRAPMSGRLRFAFQSASDHFLDAGVRDRTRRSGARFVDQSLQAIRDESASPFAD